MSKIRINSIKIKNYRSFGNEEIEFIFPPEDYKKPVAIVGYNNSGKTNLMSAILYSIGYKYVSIETFELTDFYNLKLENVPFFESNLSSSNEGVDNYGRHINVNGAHKLEIELNQNEIIKSSITPSFYGKNKLYKIFYVNFHNIKEEISTQKTSWGAIKSFLGKHIKQIVDSDTEMQRKKNSYNTSVKDATSTILTDSNLKKFVENIKNNYYINLLNNNCHIDFSLPEYEDIFLKMIFKIGLNGDNTNLVPIDNFGDGYISMFVMAVIKAIAESNNNDKCLFLFEEPESFLHENHQEYFYKKVLCDLAEKGHQVIYTTHSDKMVNMFDTKGLIRIEFDEIGKKTVKKYNKASDDFNQTLSYEDNGEIISISDYNNYVKNIEPNLNKILFSRKIVLVEGPNDVMAYKYAIEKYMVDMGMTQRDAETYLNFKNIVIIPHHGKATALILIKLCKHLGIEFFVISDWDFETDFITQLKAFNTETELKTDNLYLNESGQTRTANSKSRLTINWKLLNFSEENIHFNIPKIEGILGYNSNDKNSAKLWKLLKQRDSFGENFFPTNLKNFLEFDKLPIQNPESNANTEPATE